MNTVEKVLRYSCRQTESRIQLGIMLLRLKMKFHVRSGQISTRRTSHDSRKILPTARKMLTKLTFGQRFEHTTPRRNHQRTILHLYRNKRKIMRVTQSLVILLALFAGTTARTRGGVRRPRLSTFTSPIEAELQIEFSKPLRILKARATDDSEAMEPAKRMGMMGRKTPAPTFSTPPSPAHVDSPTKAPKASKPPTPTKPPKEEKTKAPTPTKAPKASKPPTPIKPPKGEKASKPPTPTKEPKRDKGVKDVSEDSPVEEEGEGVEDLTAVDSESALLGKLYHFVLIRCVSLVDYTFEHPNTHILPFMF